VSHEQRLQQKLRQHTDNERLIAALVRLIDRAPDEYNQGAARAKALKKLVPALEELKAAGWEGWEPVGDYGPLIDNLLEIFTNDLDRSMKISNLGTFRNYLMVSVAVLMRECGLQPKATNGGQFENLATIVLDNCGEPTGGVHKRAREIISRIKLRR